MSTARNKKLKSIHLQVALVLIFYLLVSNTIFLKAAIHRNVLISFALPMIFGGLASAIFLYLFSHEDFFYFAQALQKKQMRVEQRWLRRFQRFGKSFTTLGIGTLGGPILGALTARLLLNQEKYKYHLVVFSAIPSTFFWMSLTRGAFGIFLKL